jgi:hypothetical protein
MSLPSVVVGYEALLGTRRSIMLKALLSGTISVSIGVAIAVAAHWALNAPSERAHDLNLDPMQVPARLAALGKPVPVGATCREQPLKVSPNPGLEKAVTDQDLLTVLCAALPWWNPPTVPSAFHELKLWGRNCVFTQQMLGKGRERTGEHLVNILLSDKACKSDTAGSGNTYLLDSPFGIRVVLWGSPDGSDYRAEAHYGQLLQILGEVGLPSSCPVKSSSARVGTIRDLYQDAIRMYSSVNELEFIACALGYWHPAQDTWEDQFGITHTFDDLMAKLISTPFGEGSCGGAHVPYAVVTLLRVNEQTTILTESSCRKARKYLIRLSHLLQLNFAGGAWDKFWPSGKPIKFLWGDELLDRITITGHHLEWIALAPPEVRPSEQEVRRAVMALREDVESLPALRHQSFKTMLPVSHAARALSLLRGVDPYSFWLAYWNRGLLKRTEKGFALSGSSI